MVKKQISLKRYALVPLGVAMAALIAVFALDAWWILRTEISKDMERDVEAVRNGFQQEFAKDTATMETVADLILSSPDLMAAMEAKDRQALLDRTAPMLKVWHERLGVTHLYLMGPDRVSILRVHQPDRYGDTIDRSTTLEAQRTGRPASGVELGPLGTLTLRVVLPWRRGERLLGYVELGHEINHLAQEIHEDFGADLFVLVNKKRLVRAEWERGMRMLNRRARWDELPDWVVMAGTLDSLPEGLDQCPEEGCSAANSGFTAVRMGDRSYLADCWPLPDARGAVVAKVLVLRDVTEQDARARMHVGLAGAAGLVLGAFLVACFLVLNRAQRQMAASCLHLAEESRCREDEQRRHTQDVAQAHSHLQMIIDAIADPFMVVDRDHRVILSNRTVREIAGGCDPVALGMRCYQVSHHRDTPCDGEADECPHAMVFNTKCPVRVTHTHFDAEGGQRVVDIVASPVLDEHGEVIQMIESCRDVTDRKRVEEELQRANGRLEEANKRLEELATTDGLTGLWNRRCFIQMLEREVDRSRRYGASLALVMFDIDHFKSVNDMFGHAAGDRVLAESARLLKAEARTSDVVARYGGEEFMVLMPNTTLAEAVAAAERIRRKVAGHLMPGTSPVMQVTVSAGASAADAGAGVSAEMLMRLADEALYDAKRAGRNRTCAAGPACPLPGPTSQV